MTNTERNQRRVTIVRARKRRREATTEALKRMFARRVSGVSVADADNRAMQYILRNDAGEVARIGYLTWHRIQELGRSQRDAKLLSLNWSKP